MNDKDNNRRPLYERIYNANILSDASLFSIKPSDLVIKNFEENADEKEMKKEDETDSE